MFKMSDDGLISLHSDEGSISIYVECGKYGNTYIDGYGYGFGYDECKDYTFGQWFKSCSELKVLANIKIFEHAKVRVGRLTKTKGEVGSSKLLRTKVVDFIAKHAPSALREVKTNANGSANIYISNA